MCLLYKSYYLKFIFRYPNAAALAKAKGNVERHFAVVGINEEFDNFIRALEFVIPNYFKGISSVYKDMQSEYWLHLII